MSANTDSQFKEGSVIGGILLIAGSCIGGGMLALPVITGIGGFFPSVFMFVLAWLFMTSTGLLLLEANLAIGHHLSLISIAERTLGKTGKILCWVLFIFLFYSLSIAYISASGSILQSITADLLNVEIPAWSGSLLFTVVFAIVLYTGTRHVDYVNRLLMVGLIAAYLILVILGSFYIKFDYLAIKHWKYAFAALPILVISFGFHNMIPSLSMYMRGNIKRLRKIVIVGSVIPLVIYLVWEAVMLGIIPLEGRDGLLHALNHGEAATQALRAVAERSWISTVAQIFALFAIITSFLAQSLSLVDFLSDGLKIPKIGLGRIPLILMTLVPPFAFAFVYPGIFLQALNMAGGFSAVILFGIMPVLMVWVLRYKRGAVTSCLLPFGQIMLICVFCVAMGIFLLESAQELGFSLIPQHVEAAP